MGSDICGQEANSIADYMNGTSYPSRAIIQLTLEPQKEDTIRTLAMVIF